MLHSSLPDVFQLFPEPVRLRKPSGAAFREQMQAPVILEGMMDEWAALKKWNLDYFEELFGGSSVVMRTTDQESEVIFGGQGLRRGGVKEYLASIRNASCAPEERPPYMGNISLVSGKTHAIFKPLRSDFEFPSFFEETIHNDLRLWIAAKGQTSTIHNDNYRNFNAQVLGEKAFLLFPPEAHPKLYPREVNPACWASPVDPMRLDRERFPNYETAQGLQCILRPGEMLFIPLFWWHWVHALSISISVNDWISSTGEHNVWRPYD